MLVATTSRRQNISVCIAELTGYRNGAADPLRKEAQRIRTVIRIRWLTSEPGRLVGVGRARRAGMASSSYRLCSRRGSRAGRCGCAVPRCAGRRCIFWRADRRARRTASRINSTLSAWNCGRPWACGHSLSRSASDTAENGRREMRSVAGRGSSGASVSARPRSTCRPGAEPAGGWPGRVQAAP